MKGRGGAARERSDRGGRAAPIAIVFGTMLLYGLVESVRSVTYPLMKSGFGADYASQGGFVSLAWVVFVLFCLLAGFFQGRFGVKRAMLAGYLLMGAGAALVMLAPSFWLAAAAIFVVNAGYGFVEVGSNAMASALFTKRAALSMNLMHFFYGFGAIAGPQLAGWLLTGFSFSWRQVYLAAAFPMAGAFLFILFTRIRLAGGPPGEAGGGAALTFGKALRHPLVWLFAVTLGLFVTIEFGAASWGGLYLKDVYGLDPATTGAAFVSVFYALFTLSRLVSGPIVEKAGAVRSLIAAAALSAATFLIGFLLGRDGIWVLPATGLFIGIMYPTLLAAAMGAFGADAPAATGAVITIAGLVSAACQFAIGQTSQLLGSPWGYRSCLIYAVLELVMLFILADRCGGILRETSSCRSRDIPLQEGDKKE